MNQYKLFTVGPVMMFDYTLRTAAEQVPYFRTSEFSDLVSGIDRRLKKLTGAPENWKTVLLTCSGTGAMEAAVDTLPRTEKVLVINGGTFGQRFVDLLSLHGIDYDEVTVPYEYDLTDELLAPYESNDYFAVLVNIHETSIGKLYDIDALKRFVRKKNCYLIVDAISSFLADEYDAYAYGADLTMISSQKALALHAGLSALVISERYDREVLRRYRASVRYLDVAEHLNDMKRGQTPFTPAQVVIHEMAQRLEKIETGGVRAEIARVRALSEFFRRRAADSGYGIPTFRKSDCLTPIVCPKHNATEIFERLKNDRSIFVTPCGGARKDEILRIGHIGNLCQNDFEILLEALGEYV